MHYFIDGEEPKEKKKEDHGKYDRRENVIRDMEIKSITYDDKKKGQFMRVKPDDNNEYESKLKAFEAELNQDGKNNQDNEGKTNVHKKSVVR